MEGAGPEGRRRRPFTGLPPAAAPLDWCHLQGRQLLAGKRIDRRQAQWWGCSDSMAACWSAVSCTWQQVAGKLSAHRLNLAACNAAQQSRWDPQDERSTLTPHCLQHGWERERTHSAGMPAVQQLRCRLMQGKQGGDTCLVGLQHQVRLGVRRLQGWKGAGAHGWRHGSRQAVAIQPARHAHNLNLGECLTAAEMQSNASSQQTASTAS